MRRVAILLAAMAFTGGTAVTVAAPASAAEGTL